MAAPESSSSSSLSATTAPLGRGELRRLRLSDQNLDWEGGGGRGWGGGGGRSYSSNSSNRGGGGTNGDDDEFASAWGGSSWGGGDGGGSTRLSRASSFVSAAGSLSCSVYGVGGRTSRSVSGESEFYDAADGGEGGEGESPPISPDRWVYSAAAAGGAAAKAAAAATGVAQDEFVADTPQPQPGGEDTGSGEEGWDIGTSALAAAQKEGDAGDAGGGSGGGGRGGGRDGAYSDGDDDGDGLEFQDARDPVSEVSSGAPRRGGTVCGLHGLAAHARARVNTHSRHLPTSVRVSCQRR